MRMRVRLIVLGALCATVLLGLPRVNAGTTTWEVLDLGPTVLDSEARAINNAGTVVGVGTSAWVWSNGALITLTARRGDSPTVAGAVNDKGIIAGTSNGAATWKKGKAKPLAKVRGYRNSVGADINESGQVAGSANDGVIIVPALWAGGAKRLATLPGATYSHAYALNNTGLIVGETGTPAVFKAAVWSGKRRTLVMLETPNDYTRSLAEDVNDQGAVVGFGLKSGVTYPLVWSEVSGAPTELPQISSRAGSARAINASGAIVGFSSLESGQEHAVTWQTGVLTDLNDLLPGGSGWLLEVANDINDSGWIVGYGRHNGHQRGFLLRPAQ